MKKTVLFPFHEKKQAKMTHFCGWEMPVSFTSIQEEHLSVRNDVGIFDISHMAEIFIEGENCIKELNYLTTSEFSSIDEFQAKYTLLLNEKAGIMDDVIIYCLKKNKKYMICVNACNRKKVLLHLKEKSSHLKVTDESDLWAQIALQGPKSTGYLKEVLGISPKKAFSFLKHDYKSTEILVCFTGYTGEKGCEIFIPMKKAASLWKSFLEKNIKPIGLAARDSLRIEKTYSLYGQEISEKISPIEADLMPFVDLQKDDFIGKNQLKKDSFNLRKICFLMLEKAIPRSQYSVFSLDQKKIGYVTSGTFSPVLQKGIGMALISKDFSCKLSDILVEIRGRFLKAKVTKGPFVK